MLPADNKMSFVYNKLSPHSRVFEAGAWMHTQFGTQSINFEPVGGGSPYRLKAGEFFRRLADESET